MSERHHDDDLSSALHEATGGRQVIEELTVVVDPSSRAEYIARDAEVWTPFLRSCDGFLGKEVWLPDDRPDTVVFIIRWASLAQWKAISPERVAEVDRGMGHLYSPMITCRSHQLV